ncbi:pyridoxal 5'-phosphate synthase glutaminase subunit PdxT [Planococcus lenghuensis]|uniref:Pyridoxal 5'-phosphate synthase subunit PdxT n=1 Tax=Planococcus lenghuensis TaxID=2213202 RepID=A0A1Q2L488_9BACL|nr:pyridoxal 5'-phosphate synthase glutaminase subunit PdxT [Planococcus lenghuensis]AQQ54672.1 glutamine amidotransferase subunit PdxT [Planococcus lenghuensis]
MTKIGILALQGAVREHVKQVEACGAEAKVIKRVEDIAGLDGLILPGGESTTMRRLIDRYELMEPLRAFAASGKPIFGTCAGLILMAKTVEGYDAPHLGLMDVTVARNSFGRQIHSFETELAVKGIDNPVDAVFIRAPHITAAGPTVEVLAEYDGRIVMVRDGQFMGCSFHPELTEDISLTRCFIDLVRSCVQVQS